MHEIVDPTVNVLCHAVVRTRLTCHLMCIRLDAVKFLPTIDFYFFNYNSKCQSIPTIFEYIIVSNGGKSITEYDNVMYILLNIPPILLSVTTHPHHWKSIIF